ncbi:thioredoxin-like domain-containing protein [uncultured Winogradskyella sp.]|uniref:TlpA family protein disulfide reductase n=1 Tax=uncultured Winogradskyella sp. TaxID=395353 RepID=UPI0026096FD2|nr:thioredoxin-like domain-containing protein [uncultured Winogradskyella sp.]
MKIIKLTLLLLIFVSCNKDNKDLTESLKDTKTLIQGHIKNYKNSDEQKQVTLYFNNEILQQQSFKIDIDSLGNFKTEIDLPFQQDVNIYYKGWLTFIVKPSDSISFSIDGSRNKSKDIFESLVLNGDSKRINKSLHKFIKNDTLLNNYYDDFSKLEPNTFLNYHDSIFTKRNEYITKFISKNSDIDAGLKNYLKAEKDITPIEKILEFPMYFEMYNREKSKSIEYPDSFFASLKNLPKIDYKIMVNGNVSGFGNHLLFYYYKKLDKQSGKFDKANRDSLIVKTISNDFKDNTVVAQLAINDRIKSDLAAMNLDFAESQEAQLQLLYGKSHLGKAIFKNIEDTKKAIENPPVPKDVQLLAFDSKNPEDFLQEIINNANGKIIYIDNWGPWCAPCRSEFKTATPKLKERFGDKIEYVYICHLSEEKPWKSSIAKYGLSGKHYIVTKEQTEKMRQSFKINGYPTYNIIDVNGNMLHAGFEYRPSLPNTIEILDKLVN